jgi:twitching motility protein PilT
VVSPLDPDWRPDGVAPANGVAMPPQTHAPAAMPSVAAPFTPAPAPAAQVPTTAHVLVDSSKDLAPAQDFAVADVPEQPAAASATQAGAADAAYARGAIEESSDLEAGLLTDLLVEVLDKGASDLHITAGARPTIRIHGSLQQLDERPIMTPPTIQRMIYAVLTQRQREKFEEVLELDFAYAVPGKARFRVNVYRQRDALGAAFRLIPYEIKPLEDLGIPPSISNFAMLPRGFVLVTGPTGSGKSTTLASLVDLANRNRRDHIMTVEDPIEFLHRHKSCLVNQREVGEDTWSFQNALKHVLRQDPDIILVGEMRDLETISVALTAAETGHLVFATLHTQDAAQTIDRVIDVFPPHQQQQVRVQLAGALQGVVCQALAKTADGQGRIVATEVLVATPAIRNLIREGKTHQIYSALQAGAKHGMHTMDQHLADLVKQHKISYETGVEKCHHIEDFNRLCGRA